MSTATPQTIDLSKYIELRDGRAHVRGRRLPVAFIAIAERERQLSIAELAYDFTLSEEQVLAALPYYREHKAEIDAQDAADGAESDDLHLNDTDNDMIHALVAKPTIFRSAPTRRQTRPG